MACRRGSKLADMEEAKKCQGEGSNKHAAVLVLECVGPLDGCEYVGKHCGCNRPACGNGGDPVCPFYAALCQLQQWVVMCRVPESDLTVQVGHSCKVNCDHGGCQGTTELSSETCHSLPAGGEGIHGLIVEEPDEIPHTLTLYVAFVEVASALWTRNCSYVVKGW